MSADFSILYAGSLVEKPSHIVKQMGREVRLSSFFGELGFE